VITVILICRDEGGVPGIAKYVQASGFRPHLARPGALRGADVRKAVQATSPSMIGPGHYRRAEALAEEARKLLGQGEGQDTAVVWAAVVRRGA
jgi:hypothetical protein